MVILLSLGGATWRLPPLSFIVYKCKNRMKFSAEYQQNTVALHFGDDFIWICDVRWRPKLNCRQLVTNKYTDNAPRVPHRNDEWALQREYHFAYACCWKSTFVISDRANTANIKTKATDRGNLILIILSAIGRDARWNFQLWNLHKFHEIQENSAGSFLKFSLKFWN